MAAVASPTTRRSTPAAQTDLLKPEDIGYLYSIAIKGHRDADMEEDQFRRDLLHACARECEENTIKAAVQHSTRRKLRLIQQALNIITTLPARCKGFEAFITGPPTAFPAAPADTIAHRSRPSWMRYE